jgi:hypothetical protein
MDNSPRSPPADRSPGGTSGGGGGASGGGGAKTSLVGRIMSKSILGGRDSTAGGGASAASVNADLKQAQRAEKEASASPVAELLRSLGLAMYIKPIVMQLGYDNYDVIIIYIHINNNNIYIYIYIQC